jgi:hypothetical protein
MTRTRSATAALAIGLLLAACGGGGNGEADKTASQILADAVAALKSAKSFHISAKSAATGTDALSLDLDLLTGGSARGKVTSGGATANVVVLGGKFYIQGRDFWNKFAGPQAATVIGDRWAILPSNADTSGFVSFVNTDTLATCLGISHGTITKGGTTTVAGQGAVILVDKGDKPGTAPGKLYVATSGPAYPLKLETTGTASAGTAPGGAECNGSSSGSNGGSGNGPGSFTLTNFGTVGAITPPPSPLDLSSLGG